jgi:predicted HicB family RNase H-like nuclease
VQGVLIIEVPLELAEKVRRLGNIPLAWCFTPCKVEGVPDSPDTDKEMLGIRIERTLKRRVELAAAKRGLSVTDLVRELLVKETAKVTLTAKDDEEIAKKVREAEKARDRKKRAR